MRHQTRDIDAYPASMEADRTGGVYRVSTVDERAFTNLFFAAGDQHYYFAIYASPIQDYTTDIRNNDIQ